MKPAKNLLISFIVILIFSIYLFILSYHNKKQSEVLNRWVMHTHLVLKEITELEILITEFEAQDQNNVLTNDKDIIRNLSFRNAVTLTKFSRIKFLTADNPVQQRNIRHLVEVCYKKQEYVKKVFTALNKSKSEALGLLAQPESKNLYADIKSNLRGMLEVENELLKHRTAKYEKALKARFNYFIVFAATGLISLIIAFWKIYRESLFRNIEQQKAKRSEEKYKGLIEKSSLIIFTNDLHGRFTYISDKGLEFTGYEKEELIGRDYRFLLPGNTSKEVAKFYLSQYKIFLKDLVEEFEIKTKDGVTKVIELSVVLLKEDDNIVGFQSIARDITQFKYVEGLINQSKAKLNELQEESNFRLQSVLNNIPMALSIKDLEGKYIVVNKNFTDTFGIDSEMIIGKTNYEVPQFNDKAKFYDDVDSRVKNSGKPAEFEERVPTKAGERIFLVTRFPLFDISNNIFAISSVAKDITDMAFYRQQLIDARLKAENAEQLQESFLANMSHEIRTPMNGIVGMTNILLETHLDNEQKEYADLIKKSSDLLLVLINDILDLSKIKAGRMELEAIDFDLRDVVQNVLQPMRINLKKEVAINYSIRDSVPEFVVGDSHKLFQVLNNLLSNAIKFTEKGEIKVTADVGAKTDETVEINLAVSDTGMGISPRHIANIFDSFTQAGNDTVRKFGGTGLGLAITKKMIELQKGTIKVESVVGHGTTFYVTIPYLYSRLKNGIVPAKDDSDINLKKKGIENKKILIVEDNIVNQRVITGVLKKLNAILTIANDGKEAVDILKQQSDFHLIIMDLQMPVMNGFETTEYIRKKLKLTIPIIAMTASTLKNEKVKCLAIGMNSYLAKPFSPSELIRNIYGLIHSHTAKENLIEPAEEQAEKLFDLAYLHELENNEYLVEMIGLFFESADEALQEIDVSIKNNQWDAVSKASHKIKSSLGALQVSNMILTASAMEQKAKDITNCAEVIELNKQLHNQYNTVKPLIEAELEKAKQLSKEYVTAEVV